MNPIVAKAVGDFVEATITLLRAVQDGQITMDEAEEAIDAAIDSGPFEPLEDSVVEFLVPVIAELFVRDPGKMRARADRVEFRGHSERAAKIRARASKVEAKRSDGA